MEDDYLPLYEVVDYDKDNDHSSNAAKSRGYEKLIGKDSVVDGVQEEYQLPQSEARYVPYETYSEVATEIQTLKRNSRHVKTVFSIGGIIMFILVIIIVCISAVMWIRFGKNLVNVQKSLIEDVNNVQEHSNAKQPEHDWSFQNCSQETTVCNFTKNPSGSGSWLYCDTPRLKTDKRDYYTLDVRCNHKFNPIQNSLLASSLESVSNNSEIFCRCSIAHPTTAGHSVLPLPDVTPNCILVITRCPVF